MENDNKDQLIKTLTIGDLKKVIGMVPDEFNDKFVLYRVAMMEKDEISFMDLPIFSLRHLLDDDVFTLIDEETTTLMDEIYKKKE
jgi:hypothetical protein